MFAIRERLYAHPVERHILNFSLKQITTWHS